jgi:hypothetical protein
MNDHFKRVHQMDLGHWKLAKHNSTRVNYSPLHQQYFKMIHKTTKGESNSFSMDIYTRDYNDNKLEMRNVFETKWIMSMPSYWK